MSTPVVGELLHTFIWSADASSSSSTSNNSSSSVNYAVKPETIVDLFAVFDPNLIVNEYSCEPESESETNFDRKHTRVTHQHFQHYRVNVTATKTQKSAGTLKPLTKVFNLSLKTKTMTASTNRIDSAGDLICRLGGVGSLAKERTMYEKVLLDLTRFQKRVGVVPRDLWLDYPLYFGGGDDYLAIENLAMNGYARASAMDHSHVIKVMKSLGKFHAASFGRFKGDFSAIEAAYPELIDSVWSAPPITKDYLGHTLKSITEQLRSAGHMHEVKILEQPHFSTESLFEQVCKLLTGPILNAVIGHGNLWLHNLAFKYKEGTTEPVGVKFTGFEMARICARSVDLILFLTFHTEGGLGRDREAEYLRFYYDSFATHARRLGCFNFAELIFDEFQEEYNKYRPLAIVMGLIEDGGANTDRNGAGDFLDTTRRASVLEKIRKLL